VIAETKELSMKQGVAIVLMMLMIVGLSGKAAAQERSSTSSAVADSAPDASARSNGVPIERVIAAVANKTGKKYLLDARVQGNVEILGQDISAVTYSDLLSILLVSGYTAVEGSNYISVVPESIVRALPLPLATAKDTFPDAQFVTAVVPVKNTAAAQLVPILRPLMPTHGHLAAMPCVNSLVLVDNFANVKRLEKVIASLDVGTPYVPHACDQEPAHPPAHP
jgi:type II secretory pathway component GspD/PulD (secretin)